MLDLLKIGIVDDHRPYAFALADSLSMEKGIVVVGVAANGEEALALVRTESPDILLMDLDMPVMDGVTATRRIKAEHYGVEVIALTVFDDGPHLFQALQAGARGYLLKNAETHEIAQAVRDVADGGAVLPPILASKALAEFNRLAHQQLSRELVYEKLTRQETETLKLLSQRMTNEQICRELHLEMTTVKKHVGNILKKLEVNNRQAAAQIARAAGM